MKYILRSLLLGVFTLTVFTGCSQDTPVAAPTAASAVASNAPAAAPAKNPYELLKGKWERPDGGYVLEIRSADAEGKLEAGYFNPSPINVSQARAVSDGGTLKVFIELRDANYPGCTYKLSYDAKTDQLFGQYFQASMQETYDVAFARLK